MNKASNLTAILKFILGILILPAVLGVTINFYEQLLVLDTTTVSFFIWGIIWYLVLHIFVYEPNLFYKKGQRLLEIIFHFFAPLVKLASYVLPIYTIIIFCLYFIVTLFLKDKIVVNYFTFLISFSLSFHIVFSATLLRRKDSSVLKPNYLFGFSLIYILNICLVSFMFNLMFESFSFVDFFNASAEVVKRVYAVLFGQLFLSRR